MKPLQNELVFPPTRPEFPQMTVLNLVLGGTIFTKGGYYSLVNNVLRGHFWGGTLYTMTTVRVVLKFPHPIASVYKQPSTST